MFAARTPQALNEEVFHRRRISLGELDRADSLLLLGYVSTAYERREEKRREEKNPNLRTYFATLRIEPNDFTWLFCCLMSQGRAQQKAPSMAVGRARKQP
jgi:hypothetical protein